MKAWFDAVSTLLGLAAEPKNLTLLQISLRGVVIFFSALLMMRIGHKRSLARKTAFDSLLVVLLAAVLSRAINGSAAFFPTIGAGFVLVGLHRLLAALAYHSHRFGLVIKGCDDIVVENGRFVADEMRRNYVTRHDIEEDMRLSAKTNDLSKVSEARVERSGDISFITTGNL